MKVKEVGESGLIELLSQAIQEEGLPGSSAQGGFQLILGPGDDAAIWKTPGSGALELCTTDTLVQGVHFLPSKVTWEELGWKAMAVNLSDIAALGGQPLYAVVTLGLPGDVEVDHLLELYRGMLAVANEHATRLVGGDVVRSPIIFISVTLTGVCLYQPLLRSAARPGDQVAVTGRLGASAAGLRAISQELPLEPEDLSCLRGAHLRPRPRVREGQILGREGVKAAMDISDGLLEDLAKLCKASGVAARVRIEDVPCHPLIRKVFPDASLSLALSGGEDYELLFTAPPQVMEKVLPQLPTPVTVIGEIVSGEGVRLIDGQGREIPWERGGWDHFLEA